MLFDRRPNTSTFSRGARVKIFPTIVASLLLLMVGAPLSSQAATFVVNTADELAAAIEAANSNSDASNTISFGSNIDLSALTPGAAGSTALPTLGATGSNKSLVIDGAGHTVSGGGVTRIFFANTGDITIQNVTLADGVAQGGNGGNSVFPGGGGMGAGGALFVRGDLDGHQAPSVTLANVSIVDSSAVGGNGGSYGTGGVPIGGGGGGMGGNGGSDVVGLAGGRGGGGAFPGQNGGDSSNTLGREGGGPDGGSSENGADGGAGGEFSGGGGAGAFNSISHGGNGGFGGGGGGGNNNIGGSTGGDGGFGGGGGGAGDSGAGGYGGGGGREGAEGGFGGSSGSFGLGSSGGGGGGAGAGGALFVMEGANLTITGSFTINGGSVAGGTGGGAADDAAAFGTGFFLHGSGALSFVSDGAQTIGDNIDDEAGVILGGYVAPARFGAGGNWGLEKSGTGGLELTGINSYTGDTTVQDGALIVNGTLLNSATTVHAGATLMGTGTLADVTVAAGGIHAPGNSIGTQTVNGPYLLQADAILEIEIAPGTNNSDLVIVNGTVDITGAILAILRDDISFTSGTEYLIIDNDGADPVNGTFASVISDFAFFDPTINYAAGDGNDVVLTLLRNAVDFVDVAQTPNQAEVAGALDQFPPGTPLADLILNQTEAGARMAFDALSGEVHATVGTVLANDSRFVRQSILGRLQQAHYTGGVSVGTNSEIASLGNTGTTSVAGSFDAPMMGLGMGSGKGSGVYGARPVASPLVFWTQAFGSWGDFEGDGNAASAERTIGGFLSGVDTSVGSGWHAGAALGYSRANVSVSQRISSAEIDSYHLAAYAGGPVGAFALRSGASWSWNDIDTERTVVFPGFIDRVEADYDGDTGQIFGEIAVPMSTRGFAYEPFANLAYVHVSTDRFTEQGGLAALDGFGGDQDVGFSTIGVRFAAQTFIGGTNVTPRASFAWQHAFGDVDSTRALAFAGGPTMTIEAVPLARDTALIEAGLDLSLSPAATLGISYNGQIASDVEDHGVSGRLNWRF